jgi:hypothetical protein
MRCRRLRPPDTAQERRQEEEEALGPGHTCLLFPQLLRKLRKEEKGKKKVKVRGLVGSPTKSCCIMNIMILLNPAHASLTL